MRILHLYKDYYPVLGGIENHIRSLAEAQVARGHEVSVLTTNLGARSDVARIGGVKRIRAGRIATIASTPISPAMVARLRRIETDIVHLHFPYPAGEITNLLVGRARRTIITYHSDIVRQRRILQIYTPLLRHVLRTADRIIATSAPYLRSSPFLRAVQDRCAVVPLGIDLARFAEPSRDAAAVRAAAGVPAATPLVLFVGVLRYYKGLDTLISAMALIPDAHLVIVGDGPMRNAITSMAAQMGLTSRVTLTGQVDDATLSAWYSAGDLFVLPSNVRAEAFGTAILEAMAAGLAVVSTEVGSGTSWVNQHGVTGTVVAPQAPRELADAIRELIENPARRRAMGDHGRTRVRDEFSIETMVAGVEAVYRQALDAPPVSRRA